MVLHEAVNGAMPATPDTYLDAEARRSIAKGGGSKLSDLDAFDATQIVNEAINRRARRRKLLTAVNIEPYVPNALVRVVAKATAPDPAARFASSTDFLAALEKIEAPNWRRQGAAFRADAWRGCDWLVSVRGSDWIAERRKTADYRHWRTAADPAVLFDAILEL